LLWYKFNPNIAHHGFMCSAAVLGHQYPLRELDVN
jgi:hypothetical protein